MTANMAAMDARMQAESGKCDPLPTAALDVLHQQHAEGEGLVCRAYKDSLQWNVIIKL